MLVRSPKIKLSVNAWSYYVPVYRHMKGESGGMSLFDMLEECARRDVDTVDPTGYFLSRISQRAGLEIYQ